MALGEGSAAMDAGDDAICAAPPVNNLDQRGITRPQGAHCDIGAYEYEAVQWLWHREAENAPRTGGMLLGTDTTGASACRYVYYTGGEAGSITFDITVPYTSGYYLWARAMGLDWNQNSFWVSVDGSPAFQYEIGQFGGQWTWGWEPVHVEGQPVDSVCSDCRPAQHRVQQSRAALAPGCRVVGQSLGLHPNPVHAVRCDAYTYIHQHGDDYAHGNADIDADANADGHCYLDGDAHSNVDADGDRHAVANAHSHANGNGYPDVDACPALSLPASDAAALNRNKELSCPDGRLSSLHSIVVGVELFSRFSFQKRTPSPRPLAGLASATDYYGGGPYDRAHHDW